MSVKRDQLDNFVEKVWGHEEWIVNNDKYCGKKLVFNKGYCCSLHCHKIKDETFYVLSGKIILELQNEKQDGDKKISRVMTSGDIQHIAPGAYHRIIALEPSEIIEFSTFHMDDDSYRISSSSKVDLENSV